MVVEDTYSYDGYGVMLSDINGAETASNADTSLLYAGEQYDGSADMYYNRARYYDPSNGRFNRTDPYAGNTQDPQSLHKYLYCHNNPVNMIDPGGEMGFIATAVTVIMLSGLICMGIAGIDAALDKASTIDDIFFAMQMGLLIGVGAGLLATMLGPVVMAAIAPYLAYIGLILGGIMTYSAFKNSNIAQGIFRAIVTIVSFGLAHPKIRANCFKFARGIWLKMFGKLPKLKMFGNPNYHQKTAIYNHQSNEIIVGDGVHAQVYMEAGLNNTCSNLDDLVGGFATFDDAGNLISIEWTATNTFGGTETSRAAANAAGQVFLASQ